MCCHGRCYDLLELSENLHLKRALTPKIRDQEVLTHPLAYCTWITEFAKQDVNESEFRIATIS